MNDDSSFALYRPCVGIALFNTQGLVFVGERIDTPGAWQMPQGGINHREDIRKAALRELREEIGTNKVEILNVFEKKIRYDLPDDLRQRLWKGKYRGQEQTWVAARFLGRDKDINIAVDSDAPPEFSKWRWMPLTETIEWIVPFKKEAYRTVIAMMEPFTKSSD